MAATMNDLLAAVTAQKTSDDSIITLLVQIKGLLDAAIATGDMTKVQTAVDALVAEQAKIAAAVAANQPTTPAPVG